MFGAVNLIEYVLLPETFATAPQLALAVWTLLLAGLGVLIGVRVTVRSVIILYGLIVLGRYAFYFWTEVQLMSDVDVKRLIEAVPYYAYLFDIGLVLEVAFLMLFSYFTFLLWRAANQAPTTQPSSQYAILNENSV